MISKPNKHDISTLLLEQFSNIERFRTKTGIVGNSGLHERTSSGCAFDVVKLH